MVGQECGIINFLEWQTLDARWAVLSHPLLGVLQPPSLLPVILNHLHFLPKQRPLFSYAWCSVRGEWQVELKDAYTISQLCYMIVNIHLYNLCYMNIYSICVYGSGGRFLKINSWTFLYSSGDSTITLCQHCLLLPPVWHMLQSSLWCNNLSIRHKFCVGALTTHSLMAYHQTSCILGWPSTIICSQEQGNTAMTAASGKLNPPPIWLNLLTNPHQALFGFLLSWVHKFSAVGAKVSMFARLASSDVKKVGRPWGCWAGSSVWLVMSF